MKPILLTGVTGRHGGTGAALARLLTQDGLQVRALTRTQTDIVDLDVEWAIGDLHDRRTLLEPLEDVEVAFFTYPVAKGIVEAAANFASAARETGLRRIVVMSMAASNLGSPSPLGRAQWLAEEIFDWAELSPIKLRIAAFFFENIELLHGAQIRGDGVIRNSFSDVAVSWISGLDAAKLAKAAILHPERFPDGVVSPTGSEAISHGQVAALLTERFGRTFRHETITPEEWQVDLERLAGNDPRINRALAEHISILGGMIRQDQVMNTLYEQLVGDRPTSLAEAISQDEFGFA